ncbi:hypothetical protein U1Q18_021470 [Sarracenia purpurea var. burkii]
MGGPSTSRTEHGVIAVKAWILPHDVGYNTKVLRGVVKMLVAFNFANLAAKASYFGRNPQIPLIDKFLNERSIFGQCDVLQQHGHRRLG